MVLFCFWQDDTLLKFGVHLHLPVTMVTISVFWRCLCGSGTDGMRYVTFAWCIFHAYTVRSFVVAEVVVHLWTFVAAMGCSVVHSVAHFVRRTWCGTFSYASVVTVLRIVWMTVPLGYIVADLCSCCCWWRLHYNCYWYLLVACLACSLLLYSLQLCRYLTWCTEFTLLSWFGLCCTYGCAFCFLFVVMLYSF